MCAINCCHDIKGRFFISAEDRTAAIKGKLKTVQTYVCHAWIFHINKEFQLNADGPELLLTFLSIIESWYLMFKINGKDILKACKYNYLYSEHQ